jgi:collagenase-like PrtC family protease
MRLVAPVCAAAETEALVAAGADELYCGILEPWWIERYGNHDSLSRRQGAANLSSRQELADVVSRAARLNVPVYLALNMRYTEPQLNYLTDLCHAFEKMDGTGIQVSDIGLLCRLQGKTGLRRCLSLLAVADNVSTIATYVSLGVDRVVFPRFVTPADAAALLRPFSGLEAEVMAFFDKCPLVDGYCRHYHGVAYQDENAEVEGGELVHKQLPYEPLYAFDTRYSTHSCLGGKQRYLQTHPCAACALPRFDAAGVGFAKIGGRGRALEDRLSALRFLRATQNLKTDDERAMLYQQTFEHGCQCYFGKHRQRRSAIEARVHTLSASCVWAECKGEVPPEAQRVYVGSETDSDAPAQLLEAGNWLTSLSIPTTIVLPPLSQSQLRQVPALINLLKTATQPESRLCVNDLGTLIAATACIKTDSGTQTGGGGHTSSGTQAGDDGHTGSAIRAGSGIQTGGNTRADSTRVGSGGHTSSTQASTDVRVSIGSLLARVDDPVEIAHFLDPAQNPSRLVSGPDGRPRMLTYAPPTPELIRHWHSPSALEPSTRHFFESLLDGQPLIFEFAQQD